MPIDRATVRDLCTEAVFERGEHYFDEGRIHDCTRIGDSITASVQGSELYDLRLSLDAPEFDPYCSCPYDGPGECKHVVAVLLSIAEAMPPDEGERIDEALAGAQMETLHDFLRAELARDSAMLDRFFARFGPVEETSHEEYREAVTHLFEAHTEYAPVVVTAIDFSEITDQGDHYRERGQYREAAAVYRGVVAGIDDNVSLVDAAYDHYARAFSDALDAYLECLREADLEPAEVEAAESFLAKRSETGAYTHREEFERALAELRSTI